MCENIQIQFINNWDKIGKINLQKIWVLKTFGISYFFVVNN